MHRMEWHPNLNFLKAVCLCDVTELMTDRIGLSTTLPSRTQRKGFLASLAFLFLHPRFPPNPRTTIHELLQEKAFQIVRMSMDWPLLAVATFLATLAVKICNDENFLTSKIP